MRSPGDSRMGERLQYEWNVQDFSREAFLWWLAAWAREWERQRFWAWYNEPAALDPEPAF